MSSSLNVVVLPPAGCLSKKGESHFVKYLPKKEKEEEEEEEESFLIFRSSDYEFKSLKARVKAA